MEIRKGAKVGGKTAKRRVTTKAGTGKLRGRTCVVVYDVPKPRKAFKGAKADKNPRQFRGCFTSAADATAKAKSLATMATLPKGHKRTAKKSRKSRR